MPPEVDGVWFGFGDGEEAEGAAVWLAVGFSLGLVEGEVEGESDGAVVGPNDLC